VDAFHKFGQLFLGIAPGDRRGEKCITESTSPDGMFPKLLGTRHISIVLDLSLMLESLQKLRCFFPFEPQNSGHIFRRKAQIALAKELSHLPGGETHYEIIRLDPHAYYLTTDMRPFQPRSDLAVAG
jgi:hypothetical protein